MRIVSASVIVVLAFLLPGTTTPVSGAAETTRRVYISAVDSTGAQVTDLTAGDLTVKEDGKNRPVTSLEPAVAPMQVAILVDDSGLGAFQSGVAQFLQMNLGRGQFSITLLNPQARPSSTSLPMSRRSRTRWAGWGDARESSPMGIKCSTRLDARPRLSRSGRPSEASSWR